MLGLKQEKHAQNNKRMYLYSTAYDFTMFSQDNPPNIDVT